MWHLWRAQHCFICKIRKRLRIARIKRWEEHLAPSTGAKYAGSIKCNQETRHRTHHHMKPWAAALNDPNVKDLSSHTQRKTPQDLPNIMELKNIIFSRIIQCLNKHAIIIILHHDLSVFSVLMYPSMGFNGFAESVPNWYKSQSSCKAQQRLAMDYHAQMVA